MRGRAGVMARGRLLAQWLSAPALLLLAATPAVAALPGMRWLPLCSGGDTHWVAIPLDPGKPGRDDRDHIGCAHFNCPRATKLARKARAA